MPATNKTKVTRLLKTARGQIDGIIKMLEEDRYCIDVSNQLLASQSILKKANQELIREHMTHCVKEAFIEGKEDEKIEEVMLILDKMMK